MAALGQKLELGLMRRVVGHVGTVYRSPAMHNLSPEEQRKIEQLASTSGSEPWFDALEAVRGWGFLAVFAASIHFTYRAIAWLVSALLA